MRIAAELRDHEAAGSLAEELPYWGWLEDGRTCLTRTGELIAAGCLAPAVVDGRSPEQIDRVLGRWQRLLSGLDADTRLYFYLLRRPASPEAADDESSGIVAVSQRKRERVSGRAECSSSRPTWSGRTIPVYARWQTGPEQEAPPGSCSGGTRAPTCGPRSRPPPPAFARRWTRACAVEEHTPIEMLPVAASLRADQPSAADSNTIYKVQYDSLIIGMQ